jgi:hypothetical protein
VGPISCESDLNPLETPIALIPWGASALTITTAESRKLARFQARFYCGFADAESVRVLGVLLLTFAFAGAASTRIRDRFLSCCSWRASVPLRHELARTRVALPRTIFVLVLVSNPVGHSSPLLLSSLPFALLLMSLLRRLTSTLLAVRPAYPIRHGHVPFFMPRTAPPRSKYRDNVSYEPISKISKIRITPSHESHPIEPGPAS